MADLSIDFCGIKSPNPFWLASAPPTNTGDQVMRAFDAGWGGAVWKTLGQPIVNVSSRYAAVDFDGTRVMGLNNIELITDRPLEVNFSEIAEVKKRYPKHALIVSLMVESRREAWHDIVKRAEDAGADGLELNFGCPHGMSERGMGSAVGQVPEYACRSPSWVKEVAKIPVIVKLTPNITDIRFPARAAKKGGADAVSLINTINTITGVDLDSFTPRPDVGGMSTHGGYCGPAVKPIALHMVAEIARDPEVGIPISGIGGISTWRDAAEFLLLGATTVQVCTAVMHYGYRIVEDMMRRPVELPRREGHEERERAGRPQHPALLATGKSSTSTTRSSPRSIRTSASAASSATSPARTARTSPSSPGRSFSIVAVAAPTARSTRTPAWAATCAAWSARCRAASP